VLISHWRPKMLDVENAMVHPRGRFLQITDRRFARRAACLDDIAGSCECVPEPIRSGTLVKTSYKHLIWRSSGSAWDVGSRCALLSARSGRKLRVPMIRLGGFGATRKTSRFPQANVRISARWNHATIAT
jgi:hypothetical protein